MCKFNKLPMQKKDLIYVKLFFTFKVILNKINQLYIMKIKLLKAINPISLRVIIAVVITFFFDITSGFYYWVRK